MEFILYNYGPVGTLAARPSRLADRGAPFLLIRKGETGLYRLFLNWQSILHASANQWAGCGALTSLFQLQLLTLLTTPFHFLLQAIPVCYPY